MVIFPRRRSERSSTVPEIGAKSQGVIGLDRVGERVGMVFEDLRHLLGRLQEELLRVVAQPLRIVEPLAGTDAEEDVVRVCVGVAQVVHVVGADEAEAEIARDSRDPAVDQPLLLDAVPLHLEEEVARAEDVAIGRGRFNRLAILRV